MGIRAAAWAVVPAILTSAQAFAQPVPNASAVAGVTPAQIVMMVALVGTVFFAVFSVVALFRARNRAEADNAALRVEVGDLKAMIDRAEALVDEEDQRLVAWAAANEPPLVAGSLPAAAGAPADRDALRCLRDMAGAGIRQAGSRNWSPACASAASPSPKS